LKFDLKTTDPASKARAGVFLTDHGPIETPIFMPVGTVGSVKAVHTRELLHDVKAQVILGNTYHLYLRPGLATLEKLGGLHRFNGWPGPILTDSGGYQVYSLAHQRKLTEQGAVFQSHLDGSRHLFTPENVMDTQRSIGADIVMAFDECPPYPCDYGYAKKSMELTHRWLARCCERFDATEPKYGHQQALFPIVQGSVFPDLRTASAQTVASLGRAGNAIGGLSVGEPAEQMYDMTELVCSILPADKPRYLMGVGTPVNLLECIARGVDMFDCIMPTRNGRHGMLFTSQGIINIKNEKWKNDPAPIDEAVGSYASTFYSRAYLRHLIVSGEILGLQIASLHNLCFYLWLMGQARQQLLAGSFTPWKNQMVEILSKRL
jgi:queuine tRNA-ribosyltransferase